MTAIASASQTWRTYRRIFAAAALAVLAAPLIAMQFTSEVTWGPGDFLVLGAMLAGLGAGIELAARAGSSARTRALGIVGAGAVFLAVWAELAVGIVG